MAAKTGKLGAIYWGSTSMSSTGAGQRIAMVRNWTLTETVEPIDVTSFDSSGYREYMASTGGSTIHVHGIHTWTGGAEKLWTSGGSTVNFTDWIGGSTVIVNSSKFYIRLFVQWSSTPTTGKPAVYYYGPIKVMTGVNYNTPWDGAISQDVTFQGSSKLQLAIIPSTWSSTAP